MTVWRNPKYPLPEDPKPPEDDGHQLAAFPRGDGREELAAILGLQGPDRFGAEARSRALDPLRERAARLGAALST